MSTAREQAREAAEPAILAHLGFEPDGPARIGEHMTENYHVAADAASDVWEPLVQALVDAGYLDINDEMGDSWCHFCDGSYLGSSALFAKFDESKMHHADDCPWVRAKEALG